MSVRILQGDCRDVLPTLPDASVQCVVTSPPYWGLRDYGCEGQLGLEATPEEYVGRMVEVFRGVRRVLRADGTLWCNMGDSYLAQQGNGYPGYGGRNVAADPAIAKLCKRPAWLKPKDLVGMPWRLAFALQADGWYLRADIVWAKPNPMPESVTDRPTKAHEYIFLLSKSARYFYDADAVREPTGNEADPAAYARADGRVHFHEADLAQGMSQRNPAYRSMTHPAGRNLRSVWTIPSAPFPEAHFATFPPALASRCIQAGTSEKGCCAACGAPWVRQTAVDYVTSPGAGRGSKTGRRALTGSNGWDGASLPRLTKQATTTGWAPSCACDPSTPVVPCTVLDPFGGSGTVGMVAEQLGRHSILIELSPEYVAMAEARTAQLGLFAQEVATG